MTLRTRMVVALVVLTAIGLSVFGVVTYSLYRQSLLDQVDDQLTALARPQAERMTVQAASGAASAECTSDTSGNGSAGPPRRGTGGAGPGQGLDAFGQLYVNGSPVACVRPLSTDGFPSVPTDLVMTGHPVHRTVPASTGSGNWRLFATPVRRAGPGRTGRVGRVAVVAVPMSGLEGALSRLVRIELVAAAGLLVVLSGGAWLILRWALRPLETMSRTAATISGGDLTPRVAPADDHTEVGRLGLALNTMLDDIEVAFDDRAETERRLRQFLADASHELRTPITSIHGFAELYRLEPPGGGQARAEIMGRIESESARMRDLVEDLLLLARLDEVRPLRAEQVDLSILAADACTDATALGPERPVTLDAPEPVIVYGDVGHLRQAIANLVTNAVRHTPPGTPIEVVARVDAREARLSVRDHGPGLDEHGIAHAFDRFWQADPARVGAGSGLGLSIVAGIAAEHAGRLEVENAVDGGARFTFSIPRGRVGEPTAHSE